MVSTQPSVHEPHLSKSVTHTHTLSLSTRSFWRRLYPIGVVRVLWVCSAPVAPRIGSLSPPGARGARDRNRSVPDFVSDRSFKGEQTPTYKLTPQPPSATSHLQGPPTTFRSPPIPLHAHMFTPLYGPHGQTISPGVDSTKRYKAPTEGSPRRSRNRRPPPATQLWTQHEQPSTSRIALRARAAALLVWGRRRRLEAPIKRLLSRFPVTQQHSRVQHAGRQAVEPTSVGTPRAAAAQSQPQAHSRPNCAQPTSLSLSLSHQRQTSPNFPSHATTT